MTPFQVCEAVIQNRIVDRETRSFFGGLPSEERHYWIASLYALLMPQSRRRRLAAYFTPPHLARYTIDTVVAAGVDLGKHRILDPSSGGAAFLVPLAARICEQGRQRGVSATSILDDITRTLSGIEIDPGLSKLSHLLLTDLLSAELRSSAGGLKSLIKQGDTLQIDDPVHPFDAIIGNPPYGRVFRPSNKLLQRYEAVITDGYVNLYALFIQRALRMVRPGGIVSLIVPMSFVGGPYFAALRKHVLEQAHVLRLDVIDNRSDIFLDVLYDLGVLVLRRRDGAKRSLPTLSAILRSDQSHADLGEVDIPSPPSNRVWPLPTGVQSDTFFGAGLVTLQDYGYAIRTGYFVWNREKSRYRVGQRPRANEVPLFWAHNVRANEKATPKDGPNGKIGFVKIAKTSTAIIRSDALILQRTSNRNQKRRIIAAVIRGASVVGGRGFVSENHTIVITPIPKRKKRLPLGLLCKLLNTKAVDNRFRRISGSVSVSTKALRDLPLPAEREVRRHFAEPDLSDDDAATAAYEASVGEVSARPKKAAARIVCIGEANGARSERD